MTINLPDDGAYVLGSAEVGDGDCDDPQVYESMCNIHTGSCEAAPSSELGNVCLTRV